MRMRRRRTRPFPRNPLIPLESGLGSGQAWWRSPLVWALALGALAPALHLGSALLHLNRAMRLANLPKVHTAEVAADLLAPPWLSPWYGHTRWALLFLTLWLIARSWVRDRRPAPDPVFTDPPLRPWQLLRARTLLWLTPWVLHLAMLALVHLTVMVGIWSMSPHLNPLWDQHLSPLGFFDSWLSLLGHFLLTATRVAIPWIGLVFLGAGLATRLALRLRSAVLSALLTFPVVLTLGTLLAAQVLDVWLTQVGIQSLVHLMAGVPFQFPTDWVNQHRSFHRVSDWGVLIPLLAGLIWWRLPCRVAWATGVATPQTPQPLLRWLWGLWPRHFRGNPLVRREAGLWRGHPWWRSGLRWMIYLTLLAAILLLVSRIHFYLRCREWEFGEFHTVDDFMEQVWEGVRGRWELMIQCFSWVIALLAIWLCARAWSRDREPSARDQIACSPLTVSQLIGAKTMLWLLPLLLWVWLRWSTLILADFTVWSDELDELPDWMVSLTMSGRVPGFVSWQVLSVDHPLWFQGVWIWARALEFAAWTLNSMIVGLLTLGLVTRLTLMGFRPMLSAGIAALIPIMGSVLWHQFPGGWRVDGLKRAIQFRFAEILNIARDPYLRRDQYQVWLCREFVNHLDLIVFALLAYLVWRGLPAHVARVYGMERDDPVREASGEPER